MYLKLKTAAITVLLPVVLVGTHCLEAMALPKNAFAMMDDVRIVVKAQQINATTVEILFANQQRLLIDFYSDHIFRVFQDNNGGIVRDPVAKPPAKILVDNPRRQVGGLEIKESPGAVNIHTPVITVVVDKNSGLLKAINKSTEKTVFEWIAPVKFDKNNVVLSLREEEDEFFYGGGVQNGRFSHKGKAIAIENQNSWTDGGVASPTPFYWSTKGYAVMWYTFKKGRYDFGAKEKGKVELNHESDYLDAFFMISNGAGPLLNDFYQLTGNPVLLPKFGFYQGHLNAYNRDYWKEDEKGVLFEDGKRYKEGQKDNGGIKESLNGEKDNYQFSARAVIDRYKKHDMPLGWILPNDGYGAGYGQTESLDGNIQNLKEFGEYARKNGVQIGLWTQSDLHPKDSISALLQRDIVKEVRDAGVRVLKTDVAWVGPGYSFGLNGITDVGHIMPYYGNDARPFIISLDGWAGSQRYAGIWSGDQTGGVWEYIRFHIPTYIGSGLSGQPNITSDMDGIFGGKNVPVLVRDFQWKTFTPMELNMDGWGSTEKYPHALGEPSTSINRNYLKLKSELMPYAYSVAKEAVTGLPTVRAMMLEYPNQYTLGKATQYQFMFGPSILVAPIFQNTRSDEEGNDIRNGIYLPEGRWIDYFSGEILEGNRVINNFAVPLWKLPVFIKEGAIIPLNNPHNNPLEVDRTERIIEFYPYGKSAFSLYDDDGVTEAYKVGASATTLITSDLVRDRLLLTILPSEGNYQGMVEDVNSTFIVNLTQRPNKIIARVGKKKQRLVEVKTLAELNEQENVFFYDKEPNLNRFSTEASVFSKTKMKKTPQLYVRLKSANVRTDGVEVEINGYVFKPADQQRVSSGALAAPSNGGVREANLQAYSLKPTWSSVEHADYYEVNFGGMLYSTIKDSTLLFEGLEAETDYTFQVRAVNRDGVSDWASFGAKTKSNPLEFALQNIQAETSANDQGGNGIGKLFDFDESNMWHTKWGEKSVPFEVTIDLRTINQLDKLQYLPRIGGGNGILLKGSICYSLDKDKWSDATNFEWEKNDAVKEFVFEGQPTARYVKIQVLEGVGGFGSGREMYVFKVPGTESYLPGDINNDRLVDRNDLTSYINYTGLRKGDADFEGYISNGDINKNGLIDAFDISVVATQLEGGVVLDSNVKIAGRLELVTPKSNYAANEIVEVLVKGKGLVAVNALSFALPYQNQDFEFIGIKPLGIKKMENLTNDRLHSNGTKSLYPTFVNVGNQELITGDTDLFVIRLKAKRAVKFALKAVDGFLVGKNLTVVNF